MSQLFDGLGERGSVLLDALTPLKGVVESAVDGFERARRDSHQAAAARTPKAPGVSRDGPRDGPRLSRDVAIWQPPHDGSSVPTEYITVSRPPADEARPASGAGAEEEALRVGTQGEDAEDAEQLGGASSTPQGKLHTQFEEAAVTPVAVNTIAASENAPNKHATTSEKAWNLGVHAKVSRGVVRVEVVMPSSPCAGTLAAGDVLHSCNGKPVDSIESLRAALPGHAGSLLSLRYSRQHELAQRTLILERQRDDDGNIVLLKLGKYSDGPSAQQRSPRNSTRPGSGAPNGGFVDRMGEAAHRDVAAAGLAGGDGIGGNANGVIDGHLDAASGDASHPRAHHHAKEQTRRDAGHHEIAGRWILGNEAGVPKQDGTARVSPALSLMRRYDTKMETNGLKSPAYSTTSTRSRTPASCDSTDLRQQQQHQHAEQICEGLAQHLNADPLSSDFFPLAAQQSDMRTSQIIEQREQIQNCNPLASPQSHTQSLEWSVTPITKAEGFADSSNVEGPEGGACEQAVTHARVLTPEQEGWHGVPPEATDDLRILREAKLQASMWESAHSKMRMTMKGLRQTRSLMMHKRQIEMLAMTKKMKEGWANKMRAFHVLREYRAAASLVEATYVALSQRLAIQWLIRLEAQVLESWSHHRYTVKIRRSRVAARIRARHRRLLSRIFEAYQLQTGRRKMQRSRLQTCACKRSFKNASKCFEMLCKYSLARKLLQKLSRIVEVRHCAKLENALFENWARLAHEHKSRNLRLSNAHVKRCLKLSGGCFRSWTQQTQRQCLLRVKHSSHAPKRLLKRSVSYFETWVAVVQHRRLKTRLLHRLVRTRGLKLKVGAFDIWRYRTDEERYIIANVIRCGDRRQHRFLVAVIRTLGQAAAIKAQMRRLLTRGARRALKESLCVFHEIVHVSRRLNHILTRGARRAMRESLYVFCDFVHVRRRLNQIFALRLRRQKQRTLHVLSRYIVHKRRLIRIGDDNERQIERDVLKSLCQYVHMCKQMRRITYVSCVRPLLLAVMRALAQEVAAQQWARAAEKLILLRCRRERWLKIWVILVLRDQQLRNRQMVSFGLLINRKLKPLLQLVFMAWRQRRSGTEIQFSFQLSRVKTFARRAALVCRAFDLLAINRLRRQRKARRGSVDWAHSRYWRMMMHLCFVRFAANLEVVRKAGGMISLRQIGDKRNAFQEWAITLNRLKYHRRVIGRVGAANHKALVRSIWRRWCRTHARKKRHKLSLYRLYAVIVRNERRTMCHVMDILHARTRVVRSRLSAHQRMVAHRLELLSVVWVCWWKATIRQRRVVAMINKVTRWEMKRGWYSLVHFMSCQHMVQKARYLKRRRLLRLCFDVLVCELCHMESRLRASALARAKGLPLCKMTFKWWIWAIHWDHERHLRLSRALDKRKRLLWRAFVGSIEQEHTQYLRKLKVLSLSNAMCRRQQRRALQTAFRHFYCFVYEAMSRQDLERRANSLSKHIMWRQQRRVMSLAFGHFYSITYEELSERGLSQRALSLSIQVLHRNQQQLLRHAFSNWSRVFLFVPRQARAAELTHAVQGRAREKSFRAWFRVVRCRQLTRHVLSTRVLANAQSVRRHVREAAWRAWAWAVKSRRRAERARRRGQLQLMQLSIACWEEFCLSSRCQLQAQNAENRRSVKLERMLLVHLNTLKCTVYAALRDYCVHERKLTAAVRKIEQRLKSHCCHKMSAYSRHILERRHHATQFAMARDKIRARLLRTISLRGWHLICQKWRRATRLCSRKARCVKKLVWHSLCKSLNHSRHLKRLEILFDRLVCGQHWRLWYDLHRTQKKKQRHLQRLLRTYVHSILDDAWHCWTEVCARRRCENRDLRHMQNQLEAHDSRFCNDNLQLWKLKCITNSRVQRKTIAHERGLCRHLFHQWRELRWFTKFAVHISITCDRRHLLQAFQAWQSRQQELKWQQLCVQRLVAKNSWHLLSQISRRWQMLRTQTRQEQRFLAKQVRSVCYNSVQVWKACLIGERLVQRFHAKCRRHTCWEAWHQWRDFGLKLRHVHLAVRRCQRHMCAGIWIRWKESQRIERNARKMQSKCTCNRMLRTWHVWKERHFREILEWRHVVRVTHMTEKYYLKVKFKAWSGWKSYHGLEELVRRVAARHAHLVCKETWRMWRWKLWEVLCTQNGEVTLQHTLASRERHLMRRVFSALSSVMLLLKRGRHVASLMAVANSRPSLRGVFHHWNITRRRRVRFRRATENMYTRLSVRQHQLKLLCWDVFTSSLRVQHSRHAASLIFSARGRLVRSTAFDAWMWMVCWHKCQTHQVGRMRRHAALPVCRVVWRTWTHTCKRHQLHAHAFGKMEAMLQRRADTSLRTAFFQLWLLLQHLRVSRQTAMLQAKALARPLCRWVWQRWWWVRWRRRRHMIGLQTMYFWVVKRENDKLRVSLQAMAEHARDMWHRRAMAHFMNSAKRHVPCRHAWDAWAVRMGWRRICQRAMHLAVCFERRRNNVAMRTALLCLHTWAVKRGALGVATSAATWRVYMYWRRLLQGCIDAWSKLLECKSRRTLAHSKGDQYDRELKRTSFASMHGHSIFQQQLRAQHLFAVASQLLIKATSKRDCSQVRDCLAHWRSYLGLLSIYRSLSAAHVSFILRGVIKRWHHLAAYRNWLLKRVCLHLLARSGGGIQKWSHAMLLPALSSHLLTRDLSEAYLRVWHDIAKRAALRRVLAYQALRYFWCTHDLLVFTRLLRHWRHWASTRVYRRGILCEVLAHKKAARLFAAFSVFVAGQMDSAETNASVQGDEDISARDPHSDGHGEQGGSALGSPVAKDGAFIC